MKLIRIFGVTFAIIFFVCLADRTLAFHNGGAGKCEGCHTMHNSLGGVAITKSGPQFHAGPYLLKSSDQSSSCLNCHQHSGDTAPTKYHISTADNDMPAGSPPIQ